MIWLTERIGAEGKALAVSRTRRVVFRCGPSFLARNIAPDSVCIPPYAAGTASTADQSRSRKGATAQVGSPGRCACSNLLIIDRYPDRVRIAALRSHADHDRGRAQLFLIGGNRSAEGRPAPSSLQATRSPITRFRLLESVLMREIDARRLLLDVQPAAPGALLSSGFSRTPNHASRQRLARLCRIPHRSGFRKGQRAGSGGLWKPGGRGSSWHGSWLTERGCESQQP